MKTIKNFIIEEKKYVDLKHFNFSLLLDYCSEYSFIRGQKDGISCSGEFMDLYDLMDHLYLFENSDGIKIYVSNTYLPPRRIWEVAIKYNLVSFIKIMGPGFWHPKSVAVMFDFYKMKDLIKRIHHEPFYKKYHITNINDFELLKQSLVDINKKVYNKENN